MYNNESAGPAFSEFLEMLGQRVRLKDFDKYRGGLDKKSEWGSVVGSAKDCFSCRRLPLLNICFEKLIQLGEAGEVSKSMRKRRKINIHFDIKNIYI